MPTVIECCARNADGEVRDRLAGTGAVLRVRPCLEHCGLCRDRPFLVVDGEVVTGTDRHRVIADANSDDSLADADRNYPADASEAGERR